MACMPNTMIFLAKPVLPIAFSLLQPGHKNSAWD
jgi:hypothetical protein